jgi:membrane protein DedA with SNARE-associated domain
MLLAAALAALFLGSFLLCQMFGVLTPAWTRAWLAALSPGWSLAAAAALLAADLLLPVPSSIVLAAAGWTAGWPAAAAAGAAGMLAGNLAGYWLCRLAGDRVLERLVKPEEAARFGRWLSRWGPAALVISRLVPMMAETLSCLAGFGRMAFGRFFAALLVGTVPVALFFAYVGARGQQSESPGMVLIVSLAVPAAGWLAFALFAGRSEPEG